MSEMVKIKINNVDVEVEKGTMLLDAIKKAGFSVPTLCYHEDLKPNGTCGICVVEVKGAPTLKRSCCTPVDRDGMEINTFSKKVKEARETVLKLILADHPDDCLTCIKNQNCELQSLAEQLDINETEYDKIFNEYEADYNSSAIIRDPRKCIKCGRCVQVCQEVQTVFAIDMINRGHDTVMGLPFEMGLGETVCVNCGQCIMVCPVGAIYEKSYEKEVWNALNDPSKHVIVQEAPAVRVAIGEEFGMEPGTVTSGKMHSALKRLGFDKVFDTNFSADLTIMEEGTELIHRVKHALNTGDMSKLPIITSCSPGWIKFLETYYPILINNVSTAKSPQQMFGALSKTYYAKKENIDPASIVSVSIMPCTAKKFEAQRPEMNSSGYRDVDYVLTTREFANMIKVAGIDFPSLPDLNADSPMGEYTGAGTIFGATGGVMEAALRTGYELISGETLPKVDLTEVRGMEGVREADVAIPGLPFTLKVAVAHGLGNARKILDKVVEQIEKDGKSEYHFIEIMACPGGCVGGGGQPYGSTLAIRAKRAEGLYKEDAEMLEHRKSHENEQVKEVYKEFLGEPYSEKAHKLLHTNYVKRSKY
ncbi:MAG TPA: 2Fe-2S iron-sulfur cluster binding domain-containing protein [Bacteroidetes bacterium]|nr:2Fe-2S iron-sulfur cluster binding domain-containing protein [Bacteroidota bacterium]